MPTRTKPRATEERDRTTILMSRKLKHEAKKAALDSGKTFTQFVEDSVRETLLRGRTKQKPFRLHTFGTGGLLPGIDINNSAQLWDILDAEEHDTSRR